MHVQIVAAWNGMALSAFAVAGRALSAQSQSSRRLFPVEGCSPAEYLAVAQKVTCYLHYFARLHAVTAAPVPCDSGGWVLGCQLPFVCVCSLSSLYFLAPCLRSAFDFSSAPLVPVHMHANDRR